MKIKQLLILNELKTSFMLKFCLQNTKLFAKFRKFVLDIVWKVADIW